MEWYPVGRILLWTAGFAALTTMAALFTLGGDAATITGALRRGLLRIIGVRGPATGDTRTGRRCAGDDRTGRGRDRGDDDADAQSLAGRENHRDIGPAAPPMAGYQKRGAACR